MKAVRRPATKVQVIAYADGEGGTRTDEVVTEEPLQIKAQGPGQPLRDVAVTMRTPGHDFELAVGYLIGEGAVRAGDEVREVRYCDVGDGPQLYNVVTVATVVPLPESLFGRAGVIGASCGACGKTSIDQLRVDAAPIGPSDPVPASILVALPEQLREAQPVFGRTGGVHAAGHFRADGSLVVAREDVGRHNAVDKVVGAAAMAGRTIGADDVLVLSGRVSFEMVQKAAVAGFPVVVAVSAPSSLAVRAAGELGVAVLGFTRDGAANVYSHPERVALDR